MNEGLTLLIAIYWKIDNSTKTDNTMLTLGKFFSGVPQKRKSDGDSKKIYEHKRKRGFIDSW